MRLVTRILYSFRRPAWSRIAVLPRRAAKPTTLGFMTGPNPVCAMSAANREDGPPTNHKGSRFAEDMARTGAGYETGAEATC